MTPPAIAPAFATLGDSAILTTLGDSVSRGVNRSVHACAAAVRDARLPGVLDVVPAYTSFAVHYDPCAATADELVATLRAIVTSALSDEPFSGESRIVTIPVRYDGPDLQAVADATGLSVENVIARHSSAEYFVYMMGFAPGFAYLGELDPALHLPRREAPRTRVPRGAVAIAGAQTAVYPLETPGGWHLIGSTDLSMFDARRDPPSLLRAGDRVRFEPVT
ncbi:5-oxoprolinase subunit PxpB [soil metagenome]